MSDVDGVAGVPCVRSCPAPGRGLIESLDGLRTVATVRLPGRDVVGKVTGVAAVVQGELLDGLVPHPQVLELVVQSPLPATALADHGRNVVDGLRLTRWSRRQSVGVVGIWH